MKSGKSVKGYM